VRKAQNLFAETSLLSRQAKRNNLINGKMPRRGHFAVFAGKVA